LSYDIAYIKHTDWAYEREWRVHWGLIHEPAGDGYSIYREDPRVFQAIYLGCRMQDDAVSAIVKLIRRHLPATKIFQGRKRSTAFALSFDEI
jgi:hypothetical protein